MDKSWEAFLCEGIRKERNLLHCIHLWHEENGGEHDDDMLDTIIPRLESQHLGPQGYQWLKMTAQSWLATYYPKTYRWFVQEWAIKSRPAKELITGLKQSGEAPLSNKAVNRVMSRYTGQVMHELRRDKNHAQAGRINLEALKRHNRGNQWKTTK
jgi:hypothetical protein